MGMRATEAMHNQENPRPRRKNDSSNHEEELGMPHQPETYAVVHSSAVAVRDAPSVSAALLGARFPGDQVLVREVVDGWAKLDASTNEKEMWMLIDATEHGIGKLLERVPAS